jgi:exonuclease VII small subunit
VKEEALSRIEQIIDEGTAELGDELDAEIAEHDRTREVLRQVNTRLAQHEEKIARILRILDDEEMRRLSSQDALGKIRGLLLHG